MAATLDLYIDWFQKRFVYGQRAAPFTLPSFTQADVVPIRIQILNLNPSPLGGFNVAAIVDMSLSFTVEAEAGGTPFVAQYDWGKNTNTNFFSADVDFGTAEIDTWLGAATSKTAKLKIKKTESANPVTLIEQNITIIANLSGTSPANPTPSQILLTREEADQRYAKLLMDVGKSITFRTADGTAARTIGVYKDGDSVLAQDDLYSI